MNKNKIKKEVEKNLEFAQATYLELIKIYGQKAFFPSLIMVETKIGKKKGTIVSPLETGRGERYKHAAIASLGIELAIKKLQKHFDSIDAVYLVAEAWLSVHPSLKSSLKQPRPSEDPNRRECLISCGSRRSDDFIIKILEVKRFFDLEKGEIKTSFNKLPEFIEKKHELDQVKVTSPLFVSFWNAVNVIEDELKLEKNNFVTNKLKNTDAALFSREFMLELVSKKQQ
jgi:hypothetical protein